MPAGIMLPSNLCQRPGGNLERFRLMNSVPRQLMHPKIPLLHCLGQTRSIELHDS